MQADKLNMTSIGFASGLQPSSNRANRNFERTSFYRDKSESSQRGLKHAINIKNLNQLKQRMMKIGWNIEQKALNKSNNNLNTSRNPTKCLDSFEKEMPNVQKYYLKKPMIQDW